MISKWWTQHVRRCPRCDLQVFDMRGAVGPLVVEADTVRKDHTGGRFDGRTMVVHSAHRCERRSERAGKAEIQ